MGDERITVEELQAELQADVKVLAEQIAEGINGARAGRIIADSEELVRDAHAVFRQEAYQQAIDLLQAKLRQEDFPPWHSDPNRPWANGRARGEAMK